MRKYIILILIIGSFLVFITCEGPMGPMGSQGPKGDRGNDGTSIIWKGELPSASSGVQVNWAYFNITLGNDYIFDGIYWQLLLQRGTNGSNGNLRNSVEKKEHFI